MQIFVSYARKDRDILELLLPHMKSLTREDESLSFWYDETIRPGEEVWVKVEAAIEASSIFVPLLSANFFSSDYCFTKELPAMYDRYSDGVAFFAPINCSPNPFKQSIFGDMLVISPGGRSLEESEFSQLSLHNAVGELRRLIRSVRSKDDCRSGEGRNTTVDFASLRDAATSRRLVEFLCERIRFSIVEYLDRFKHSDTSYHGEIRDIGGSHVEISIYRRGGVIRRFVVRPSQAEKFGVSLNDSLLDTKYDFPLSSKVPNAVFVSDRTGNRHMTHDEFVSYVAHFVLDELTD